MSDLRIQFHRPGLVHAGGTIPVASVPVAGGGTIPISASATAGGSQITVPSNGPWVVKLQAIGNDCFYSIATSPDPASEPRGYLASGEVDWIFAESGLKIGCIDSGLAEGVTA